MAEEFTPLAKWDDDTSCHQELVWWSKFDEKYQIEVQRTGELTAKLIIFDHDHNDKMLKVFDVSLSYGAIMGPDIDDLEIWKQMVIDYVDSL